MAGLQFKTPAETDAGFNINTNHAKRLYGGFYFFQRWLNRFNGHGADAEAYYTLRISNQFSFGEDVIYSPRYNYSGYSAIDTLNNKPVFARRNVQTIENTFDIKYTFNNIMGLTFRLRHYWSKLNNLQYFDLAPNGDLAPLTSSHFSLDNDQNYNAWNIDMIYVWQFSPGSELSLAWKSSSLVNNDIARYGYIRNFNDTFNTPKNNNFSVKVLYYIDYQKLLKKKK